MAWLNPRERLIRTLLSLEDEMAIDTAKLLAAVAQERTDNASLRALVAANTQAFKDVSAQLGVANQTIASLQAQIAQGGNVADLQAQITTLQGQLDAAQADVDKATSDLSTDNAATEAAIAANTQTPAGSGSGSDAGGSTGATGDGSTGSAGTDGAATGAAGSVGGTDQQPQS